MIDELLITLKDICILLLPILGAVVLVYLILILRKLLVTLTKVNQVITNVDGKINQLEAPLNTVTQLSHTIDGVHEASVKGVNSAIEFIVKNMGAISGWFKELMNEFNKHDSDINVKGDE